MAQSALIGAFLAGLLGGLHCVAMCGGYVAALAGGRKGTAPLLPRGELLLAQWSAHAGRITTYVLLGAALGAAGGAAFAASWGAVQRGLYVVANLLLLGLAFGIARGVNVFPAMERAGLRLYSRLLPAARPLLGRSGIGARVGMGLLWGLTPCALVYGVLPVAMLSGSASDGALVMLAFGVGTLPNLLAAGWLAGRAKGLFSGTPARVAAGLVVAAFALLGLWRALFMPAAMAHGPFCIVP